MAGRARNPYFPFYPADYMEATRKLTLEQRGAYMDVICLQMMNNGRVEDDERLMAAALVVSTRKWRKVREQLADAGKISFSDGLIIQERCLRELDELLAKRKNVAEAAAVREQSKRDSALVQPRFGAESELNQDRTNSEIREKSLETNDLDTTVVPLRARVLDSDTDKERKSPPLPPPPGGDTHGGFGRAAAAVAVGIMAAATPLAAMPDQPSQATLFSEQVPAAQPAAAKPVRKARGDRTLLPEDWILPAEWRDETKSKFGATDGQIDRQAERFKRWWLSPDSKNRLKADWKSTWLNWVDSAQSRGHLGATGTGGSRGNGYGQPARRTVIVNGRELLV